MTPPKIIEHQCRKRRSLCQPIPAGRNPGNHLMWEGSDKCNSTDGHTGHGTGASLIIHSVLTHTHTHIDAHVRAHALNKPTYTVHLHTILVLLLISSLRCVRGFPRQTAYAHAHMHPQTGRLEVGGGHVGRGGQRTGHAHRQAWQQAGNSREQPLLFSVRFCALSFHFCRHRLYVNPRGVNRRTMKKSNKPWGNHW